MKLPQAEEAIVPETKLRDYLLSTSHSIGRFKAKYFRSLGFTPENWEELRRQLLEVAQGEASLAEETGFGQKYLVSGTLRGPAASGEVVTVWIVRWEDDVPRLVTVYPR